MKKALSFGSTILFVSMLFTAQVNMSSCSKDKVTVDTVATTLYVSDTSKLGFLTDKQWIFDSVYSNYTGAGTGALEYARGGSSNLINIDNVRAVYWPDGLAEYFDNSGNYTPDSWHFADADSTYLYEVSPAGPLYGRILKLDATHFNFYDTTDHILNVQVYKP